MHKATEKEKRADHIIGWSVATAAAILLFLAGFAWAFTPGLSFEGGIWYLLLWIVALVLIAVMLVALGYAYSSHLAGIVISRQNRVSLSQLQIVLWSILFASAAFTLFFIRFRDGVASDGLLFEIPGEAATLLGISTISFGTAAGIKAAKRRRIMPETEKERARRAYIKGLASNKKVRDRLLTTTDQAGQIKPLPQDRQMQIISEIRGAWSGEPLERPVHDKIKKGNASSEAKELVDTVQKELQRQQEGVLFRNLSPANAHIKNLVEGDEFTNAAHMDLGKLQMFIFALIAIIAYALVLGRFFYEGTLTGCAEGDPCLDGLPGISTGLVGILAASHVGYLTTKAAGATRTE